MYGDENNISPSPCHNLETKQLTLAYDSVPIIRNLNLAIPPQKTTVLVVATRNKNHSDPQ
jgi:ABC-type multidrug transport system fused ATPase/permease subunit